MSQTIECQSQCTVTVVHEFQLPVLNLSLEEAALITPVIILVWCVGFAFRAFIRVAKSDEVSSTSDSE